MADLRVRWDASRVFVGFERNFARGWLRLFFASSLTCVATSSALAIDLTLTLEGEVAPSCAVEFANGTLSLGDTLPAALDGTASFSVDCNAPFEYALGSANGALGHDASTALATGSDAMGDSVPYTATITIPLEDGAPTQIADVCASADLTGATPACSFTDSGTAVAIDETGTLRVTTTAASEPLLAGGYADTLTLTVTVKN